MSEKIDIHSLDKEELFELTKNFAKNWLAHDGCWFLAIEKELGMEIAINMDREAWRLFTVVEAKRIIEFLGLPANPGIDGLARALKFRMYALLNEDNVEIVDNKTIRYWVKTCRVQSARRRKNLPDFPCKSVGIVEYSYFAKTIDERFETKCISCPPEIENEDYYCIWEFTIA